MGISRFRPIQQISAFKKPVFSPRHLHTFWSDIRKNHQKVKKKNRGLLVVGILCTTSWVACISLAAWARSLHTRPVLKWLHSRYLTHQAKRTLIDGLESGLNKERITCGRPLRLPMISSLSFAAIPIVQAQSQPSISER